MKRFTLKLIGRAHAVEFSEHEVKTFDDFCDPEREEILALEVGQFIKLDDGAVVARVE